ncbi:MAG: homocysteine biosynthesis protein [Ruminiclostridium sp.]|nr:homocysteine biosynthesis protein [Ruminiclostridium sp.]
MNVKTIEEINEKIKQGTAVVVTAEEMIGIVEEIGTKKAAQKVDVVTTGTFSPMCSSGAFINFGHSNPPIRMTKVWLNDVMAYAGIAAVDAYIGATELSESQGMAYGGAHVIEDFISGKDIRLYAESYGTDCYPRKNITATINKYNVNQAIMFNPRNCYQNYPAGTNSTDKTIYTYMGTLLPQFGNVTYCTSGQLSPLLNDPEYRTIGIGTRVFLGGAQGYVAYQGTQHDPGQERMPNGTPVSMAGTLSLIGDMKKMSAKYIRAAVYEKYGTTLFVGIGIPIPILDEDMAAKTAVSDKDIYTNIVDKSGATSFSQRVSYAELRSGSVIVNGKKVPTAPLSSMKVAREIANILKCQVLKGEFLLSEAAELLKKIDERLNKLKAED